MKNLKLILLTLISVFCNQVYSQTFKEQFNEFTFKKDTINQLKILELWEKNDNNDPELYVAYFNYFANKSFKENLVLGDNPNNEEGLNIMDNDTSNKTPIGSIYSETYFDENILKNGFDYIDIGIKKFPNRLDMRFGKIYMLGRIEKYENFTNEIIKTIEYSSTNKNKWTWSDSKEKEDGKEFMLSSIQGYQLQLYNTENDSLLENMRRISEKVLKYYPENIESLSNLSIVYILQENYKKAIDVLLKAEKINPKDEIILSNLALAYLRNNDNKNAIKYYELTMKYGNEDIKEFAKSQLEKIKSDQKK